VGVRDGDSSVQEKVPSYGACAANSFQALGDVGLEGLRETKGAITTIQCQHYNSSTAFSSVFAVLSYFFWHPKGVTAASDSGIGLAARLKTSVLTLPRQLLAAHTQLARVGSSHA
jgi:hypothetical protein